MTAAAFDIEAEVDSDAIPAIDDIDHHGELNLLLSGELGAEIFRSMTPAAQARLSWKLLEGGNGL
ncbi:hypothetical protein GCM10007919_04180 [Rhizobium indigoferae]|nr:hypothetical protein [Rhizobium indigoferae]GLR55696.1 hypothetical protein GCM10007919_04180 [Rhizobium indigoferae]